MSESIWCVPYTCKLSESSCAARHARSLVPARAGLVRHQHVHCAGCLEGAERAARLGVTSAASAKAGVDFRGVRAKALSVYVPRNGCP